MSFDDPEIMAQLKDVRERKAKEVQETFTKQAKQKLVLDSDIIEKGTPIIVAHHKAEMKKPVKERQLYNFENDPSKGNVLFVLFPEKRNWTNKKGVEKTNSKLASNNKWNVLGLFSVLLEVEMSAFFDEMDEALLKKAAWVSGAIERKYRLMNDDRDETQYGIYPNQFPKFYEGKKFKDYHRDDLVVKLTLNAWQVLKVVD